MVVTAAFAAQWRPESVLVVAVAGLIVVLFARDALTEQPIWWGMVLALVLSTIYFQHLLVVRNEPWGTSGERMALVHVWPNLKVNGLYFLDNARFPVLFTALAICGLVVRRTPQTAVAARVLPAVLGVFLFFYAGSYDFGADVRYALMGHGAVAMLAGIGASTVLALAVRMQIDRRRAAIAMAAALVFQFLSFMPLVRAVGDEGWAARADVEFVQRVAGDLPAHAVVLTQNPSLFHLRGINAAQVSLATTDPEVRVGGTADPVRGRCVPALELLVQRR